MAILNNCEDLCLLNLQCYINYIKYLILFNSALSTVSLVSWTFIILPYSCLGNYWLNSDRLPRDRCSTGGSTFRHFAPYQGVSLTAWRGWNFLSIEWGDSGLSRIRCDRGFPDLEPLAGYPISARTLAWLLVGSTEGTEHFSRLYSLRTFCGLMIQ